MNNLEATKSWYPHTFEPPPPPLGFIPTWAKPPTAVAQSVSPPGDAGP